MTFLTKHTQNNHTSSSKILLPVRSYFSATESIRNLSLRDYSFFPPLLGYLNLILSPKSCKQSLSSWKSSQPQYVFYLSHPSLNRLIKDITMYSPTSASTLDFNSQNIILNQKLSRTFSVFSMSPNIKLGIQCIANMYSSIFSSLSWPGLSNNLDHKYRNLNTLHQTY